MARWGLLEVQQENWLAPDHDQAIDPPRPRSTCDEHEGCTRGDPVRHRIPGARSRNWRRCSNSPRQQVQIELDELAADLVVTGQWSGSPASRGWVAALFQSRRLSVSRAVRILGHGPSHQRCRSRGAGVLSPTASPSRGARSPRSAGSIRTRRSGPSSGWGWSRRLVGCRAPAIRRSIARPLSSSKNSASTGLRGIAPAGRPRSTGRSRRGAGGNIPAWLTDRA